MQRFLIFAVIAAMLAVCFASCGEKGDASDTGAGTGPGKTEEEYRFIGISEMDGKYKSSDRTYEDGDGLFMLSSADSFEFCADCSGEAGVFISCVTTDVSGDADVYFTGFVDGERCEERFKLKGDGEYELILADDLPAGEHEFRVVRQTEWEHGDVRITGVGICGRLLDAPGDRDLLIEFVGDSTTTGFENMPDMPSDGDEWGGAPVFQDATQAFPFLIGEELGADVSVVAIQGVGCACGYQSFTMGDVYMNYPRVKEKDYVYSEKRDVDVVIVELLSNDSGNRKDAGLVPKDIVEKARELIVMLREVHPAAKIVFIPATFNNMIDEVIEELGGAGAGYYSIVMPADLLKNGGHPPVSGHRAAAKELAAYISDLLGNKLG